MRPDRSTNREETSSLTADGDDPQQGAPQLPTAPNPDMQSLNRLVGTWTVSGEAEGTVTYEWAEGGFFLLQHVDLGHAKGLEIIGHEQKYGETPSSDIRSRYYGFSSGETLEYTHELVGDALRIWSGERGSPAYYEGVFTDNDTLTGAWHYPGGGGYSTVSTRVPDGPKGP
jgi:hypothetical protein